MTEILCPECVCPTGTPGGFHDTYCATKIYRWIGDEMQED